MPKLLTELGLTGVGVEVGTWRGEFAERILTDWPGVLHCVDPWVYQAGWADLLNESQPLMDTAYQEALQRLGPFGERVWVHRAMSLTAAAFLAGPFDFVYLDARHDLPHVWNDMEAWAPLIRSGGLLCGHDYLEGRVGPTEFNVKSQVDGWLASHGYPDTALHVTDGDPYPTWYVLVR